MRVLMFGWEFPPNNRGGLGTACYGLTLGLKKQGTDITFVLPKGKGNHDHVDMITTENLYIENNRIRMKIVDSLLHSYMTQEEYLRKYDKFHKRIVSGGCAAEDLYGSDLFHEVHRYANKAKIIAEFEDFDIIHCHDWMTFKAGIAAKEKSGKPLVVHVHATDFDRTGGHPNQAVYDIEREGMHEADKIIAVSNFTKNTIVKHYGIDESKIEVVHNAVLHKEIKHSEIKDSDNVVLFLGRLTLQKGPEYFMHAARKTLDHVPNTKFIVAGSGDMYGKMVDMAAGMGFGKNLLFTGHLKGDDVDRAYKMADLYVMPSVSEPFGITPLEALRNSTPTLISKQSGVSEVLPNSLKVDFWDIDEMTNKMVGVLSYNPLKSELVTNGQRDIQNMSWEKSAEKCVNVYNSLLGGIR